MNDERGVLPDAKEAPLIVDAEFTETDEVVGSPILDSVERVETEKASGPWSYHLGTHSRGKRKSSDCNQSEGRVGKTTTVINVASQLGLRGYKILVVDADSQGNCATGLGVDKSKVRTTTRDLILNPETAINARHATAVDNVHMIVGDKTLIGLEQEMLARQRAQVGRGVGTLATSHDLILIDTPPSLGIVSVNALVASDGVVVPVQTSTSLWKDWPCYPEPRGS